MDKLAAMNAFAAIVEAGSFVAAADRLSSSTSTLSRLIAELEQHLGARLLNRTTRKLSLTESGQAFYERVAQLLAELDEAEAAVSASTAAPRGTLRITCSHAMGVQRLAPAIASFIARFPDVRFEVSVSDRIVDLIEEGFDLAIRVGQIGSDRLVARKLGTMRLLVCAAPAYLEARGTPRAPADLAQHAVLTYAYSPNPRVWRLIDPAGVAHDVRVAGPLHANSGDLTIAAAIAGLGIVYEPDFMVQPALDGGLLVRVLPDYESAPGEIWAVYPSRRHLSAKVRLFVEHIAQQFARSSPPAPLSQRGENNFADP
ncbi:MAG TPA: LysR family transcriptional regulator [Burkholderiales bacterium]|nr:LysR family transcriptional regulator [Burkholderiales bacterium]